MKLKNEIINETVDVETGQVIQTTSQKTFGIKVKNSEEFFMIFCGKLSSVLGYISKTDIRVLIMLCDNMQYNSTETFVPTNLRKKWCKELEISLQQFSNSIKALKSKGYIAGERGVYEVSPFFAWKGTTDSRQNLLNEGGLELRLKFIASELPIEYKINE